MQMFVQSLDSDSEQKPCKGFQNSPIVDVANTPSEASFILQNCSDFPQKNLLIATARSNNWFTGMEDTLINRSSVSGELIQYAP